MLELEAGKLFVRKIIRHKYFRKNKQGEESTQSAPIVISKLPLAYQLIVRSYAESLPHNWKS